MAKTKLTKEEREYLDLYIEAKYSQIKNKTPLQIELARVRQKQYEIQREKLREKWSKNNNRDVDINILQKDWKSNSTKVRDDLLQKTISSLSSIEGIDKVNEVLNYSLGLKNAGINVQDISKLADKVFQIDSLRSLLDSTNMDDWLKRDIIKRFVSSLFPYKDASDLKDLISSMNTNFVVNE